MGMMARLAFDIYGHVEILCSCFISSFGWAAFHHIANNLLFLKYPAIQKKLFVSDGIWLRANL